MNQKKGKNLLLTFSLILLLISCSSNEPKEGVIEVVPDYVMEAEDFQSLLSDIYLAESTLSKNITNKETPDSVYVKTYQKVFAKHNTTEKIFKQNFTYYIERSELLDKMYETLIEEMITRQGNARSFSKK